jgi:glycosyltransferase involved in cell wall biosynthesis
VKNKRLLYVASNMQHINNFHLDYINALRNDGYTVDVMARGDGADFDIPFEKKLFSPRNTAARRMIRRVVSDGKYDAILLNTSLAAFHVRFAIGRKCRPWIVNLVHGYLFSANTGFLKRKLLTLCEKITSGKTDAIITMNEEDYNIATSKRFTKGKVYRSRGMGAKVRDVMSDPKSLRSEFFTEGAYVMTFVGELSGRKNQVFLIEALKKIKERIPEATLCLVGDGGEITDFRMRVENSKLTTVRALQSCGFETIASGDSYNDLAMINASKAGFLFRSTDKIKADYPNLPAFEEFDDLLNAIKEVIGK